MTNEKFFPEQSALFANAIEGLKGKKVAVIGHVRPDAQRDPAQAFQRRSRRVPDERVGVAQHADERGTIHYISLARHTEEMIRGFVAGNGLRYVGLCTISRLDKAGDRVSGPQVLGT